MKRTFFAFFCLLFFLACEKKSPATAGQRTVVSPNLSYTTDNQMLRLQSGKFTYEIPREKLPLKKVVLLNASLVGYFTELDLEDRIVGISSPGFVYSPKIQQKVSSGAVADVGNEQKYNVEKIVALKPDAIFTNYISTFENTYELIRQQGIEIIFLDEYLEHQPLDKTRYLLLFGELFNQQEKAAVRYEQIASNYNDLKKTAATAKMQPVVLANEMYGNQWYLPGGKSLLANMLKDANADYINANSPEKGATPMSFEEVAAKSKDAKFWVNVGNQSSRKNMLQINPNYQQLPVFREGKLYSVSGREKGRSNDYFESGVVRADVLLRDYVLIFHPELLPGTELTYLKEIP